MSRWADRVTDQRVCRSRSNGAPASGATWHGGRDKSPTTGSSRRLIAKGLFRPLHAGGGLLLRHGSFILASFDSARNKGYGVAGVSSCATANCEDLSSKRCTISAARIDLVNLDQEVGAPPLPHGANQCVGVARDHVRHDIFELAQLVAAASETGVTVLPLGENLYVPAQMRRQAESRPDMDSHARRRGAASALTTATATTISCRKDRR